jgi:hypothetical protein
MELAAILFAVLLAPLTPARAAWFLQDSGSSSAHPSTPAENPQNQATDQVQPNAADQKQDESKPDQTPLPKEAESPGAKKSPTSPPAGVRKRRSRTHKPLTADGEPRKIVVHQGGASEPIAQILPGITEEEASHQRETAEQLLASTESNLKQLAARTLNPNQQEEIVQIRYYTEGARSALRESDTQRAHTLALKAYLLSEDLVKR